MIGFLGVAALVIVAPGPDFALTVRNTVRGGGTSTALGVATGQLVRAAAAAAGVAALLAASHAAFVALRLAGAAYLVWLGVATLRSRGVHVVRASRGSPYRQGLLSNLGNPKMAIFFTSLLPQFGSSFGGMLALGVVFAAFTLVWLSAYAVAVAKAGSALRSRRVRRVLDAVTGTALVALGLRVAVER